MGEHSQYVKNRLQSVDQEQTQAALAVFKSRVETFVLYQLGSIVVDMGVGCGYYDADGSDDKHEIASLMNSYLFDLCFDGKTRNKNYEHFVDYLLRRFSVEYGSGLELGS